MVGGFDLLSFFIVRGYVMRERERTRARECPVSRVFVLRLVKQVKPVCLLDTQLHRCVCELHPVVLLKTIRVCI